MLALDLIGASSQIGEQEPPPAVGQLQRRLQRAGFRLNVDDGAIERLAGRDIDDDAANGSGGCGGRPARGRGLASQPSAECGDRQCDKDPRHALYKTPPPRHRLTPASGK